MKNKIGISEEDFIKGEPLKEDELQSLDNMIIAINNMSVEDVDWGELNREIYNKIDRVRDQSLLADWQEIIQEKAEEMKSGEELDLAQGILVRIGSKIENKAA